jgi:sigma-B regulation protein RsbU (phosphoserine phosphatase)
VLLRTRITLMVSLTTLALILALVAQDGWRSRAMQQEMDGVRASGQRSAWFGLQHDALRPLTAFVGAAERNGTLTALLASGDRVALADAVRTLQSEAGEALALATVEMTAADGRPMLGVGPGEAVIDADLIDLLRRTGVPMPGLLRTEAGMPVLGVAAPLYSRTGFAGALAVWIDPQPITRELAAAAGSDIAFADVDGTLRVTSGGRFPLSRLDRLGAGREGVRDVIENGNRFRISWVAVPELAERDPAVLANVENVTEKERRHVWLLAISAGGVIAGAALFLAFLHWYMRRSFRPLYRVIQMLDALAHGGHQESASHRAAAPGNDTKPRDEIGLLAATAVDFRKSLEARDQLLKLRQDLESAAAIQASILPPPLAGRAAFDLASHMRAARDVGGDFYDFFDLPDGRFGVVIADVSGKGMGAALFMAVACTVIRSTAHLVADPGECLSRANALLAANNAASLFVTVFYGVLCPKTGTLIYANGGHNPPYRIGLDRTVSALPLTKGKMLGLFPKCAPYATAELRLDRGETLFLFTDGITEAQDDADALFGEARLTAALARCESAPEPMVREVLKAVAAFAGDTPQADDMTCLALRWNGAAKDA